MKGSYSTVWYGVSKKTPAETPVEVSVDKMYHMVEHDPSINSQFVSRD